VKHAEAEPMLLETYRETVERIGQAPSWEKHFPANTAGELVKLYTALSKPDEVTKWQTARAKHESPQNERSAAK